MSALPPEADTAVLEDGLVVTLDDKAPALL
jgi:hypothetical protein